MVRKYGQLYRETLARLRPTEGELAPQATERGPAPAGAPYTPVAAKSKCQQRRGEGTPPYGGFRYCRHGPMRASAPTQ